MEALMGSNNWFALTGAGALEVIVRGTIMYLVLLAFLRFGLKRRIGGLGISDLLVIVLIADAAQNAMAGSYNSITEGILLVGTIVFWDYIIDLLGYKYPTFKRMLQPEPLLLVENGKALSGNLVQEKITMDELTSQIRQHGVGDISEVERVYIEGDGHVSVIKFPCNATTS
jgi:uncharacterized membrane protein YcaP (DUF421 family)